MFRHAAITALLIFAATACGSAEEASTRVTGCTSTDRIALEAWNISFCVRGLPGGRPSIEWRDATFAIVPLFDGASSLSIEPGYGATDEQLRANTKPASDDSGVDQVSPLFEHEHDGNRWFARTWIHSSDGRPSVAHRLAVRTPHNTSASVEIRGLAETEEHVEQIAADIIDSFESTPPALDRDAMIELAGLWNHVFIDADSEEQPTGLTLELAEDGHATYVHVPGRYVVIRDTFTFYTTEMIDRTYTLDRRDGMIRIGLAWFRRG